MSDDENICGSTDTETGDPCKRPSGWGTDSDSGFCETHREGGNEPGGRPSAYSEERASQMIQAAERGKSKAGCARSAGVDKHTLERWLEDNPAYRDTEFRNAFARARAKGEDKLIADGLRDPDTDSSMAKFLLASSFDYVKAEKREVESDNTHRVEGEGFTVKFGNE